MAWSVNDTAIWTPCVGEGGATVIPPFAVVSIIRATIEASAQSNRAVGRQPKEPATYHDCVYFVNGPQEFGGNVGMVRRAIAPARVQYDTPGSSNFGDICGPKPGSWKMHEGYTGFRFLAAHSDGTTAWVVEDASPALAFAKAKNNSGDNSAVNCDPCLADGTTTGGTAFSVSLPTRSGRGTNVRQNQVITYLFAADGLRYCTSDYADDPIGSFRLIPDTGGSLPAGWEEVAAADGMYLGVNVSVPTEPHDHGTVSVAQGEGASVDVGGTGTADVRPPAYNVLLIRRKD